MIFSRQHDRLISFTLSAMLTSVFLASAPEAVITAAAGPQPTAIINALGKIRAAGWSGARIDLPAPPIAPATGGNSAAATPNRPITDAQFKKILADTAANGLNASTERLISQAFGVNYPGETERYDSFEDADKRLHTFSQLDNGNYIFSTRNQTISYNYYVNKNLVLIYALYKTKDGITMLDKDAAQTQAGLNTELAFFAGIANQL